MTAGRLVETAGLTVAFGPVVALEAVDFHVDAGEVVALVGDNGAGKSTLIKVLSGVLRPRRGQVRFAGRPVQLDSPLDARRLGVETVYQDLALVPLMSVARNFYLGREPTRRAGPFRLLDHEAMRRGAAAALAAVGIEVRDPTAPVESLSGGERQSIAIGRAVHFGSRVLILDEPTSALSIGETRKVLRYIAAARDRGVGVVLITHNLHHVFEVADRLVVLYHGRKVFDRARREVDQEMATRLVMTGSAVAPDSP